MRCRWWTHVFLAVTLFTGCARTNDADGPTTDAAWDSVRVAVAWSWGARGSASFGQGVVLAVEEVNQSGGIGGRPLSIRRVDDGESVHVARLEAAAIAASQDFAAVIGHLHSHISLSTAPIYRAAGLLMISPASTAPELTRGGNELFLRTVNSDTVTAGLLAAYARAQGHERVVIGYVRSEYGAGLANAFERSAADRGLEVVDRRSYDASGQDVAFYQAVFDDWASRRIDAVLLAGTAPSAAFVLQALRRAGVNVPVLGGDGLDDAGLPDAATDAAEGVTAVTSFHPDNPRTEVQRFVGAYSTRFGGKPDSWAARGYEAVQLLAQGMLATGSTRGYEVAEALRAGKEWTTLSGPLSFASTGEPQFRPGILVRVHEGAYRFEAELRADGPESSISSPKNRAKTSEPGLIVGAKRDRPPPARYGDAVAPRPPEHALRGLLRPTVGRFDHYTLTDGNADSAANVTRDDAQEVGYRRRPMK